IALFSVTISRADIVVRIPPSSRYQAVKHRSILYKLRSAMLPSSVAFLLSLHALLSFSSAQETLPDGRLLESPAKPVTFINEVPSVSCATAGRTQSWPADQIQSAITFYIVDTSPEFKGFFSPTVPRGSDANVGIDPAMPPTFAPGCDMASKMYWAPMRGTDYTDIVVLNVNSLTDPPTGLFCGVFTNADAEDKSTYHSCNKQ
ncbi:MAG: hypothetical protein LQ346_002250, partial [Caloplaca aetnensis]